MTIRQIAQLVHAVKTITGETPDLIVTANALAALESKPRRKNKK